MPVSPIDLQVLFSQMLNVGREQAIQNELVNVAQSLQATELVKQAETQSSSVNQTEPSEAAGGAESGGESAESEEKEPEKRTRRRAGRKPTFQDPELGKNVDITG